MTPEEIFELVLKLARKFLGIFIPVAIIYLIFQYLLPAIITALFGAAAVTTGIFIIVAILILILVLLVIFDGGAPGSGPCALRKYRLWPDKCVNVSCKSACMVLTGPYPKWAGSYAAGSQDIACICSASGAFAAFAPYIQKLFDQALSIKSQSELQREIERLISEDGLNAEGLKRLEEILQRFQADGKLSKEDAEELKGLLKK